MGARAALGLFAAGVVLFTVSSVCANDRSPRNARADAGHRDLRATAAARRRRDARQRDAAAEPAMDATLTRVAGADVFLIFVESYGAIAYEKPDVAPGLAAPRAEREAAIQATGRDAVSRLRRFADLWRLSSGWPTCR